MPCPCCSSSPPSLLPVESYPGLTRTAILRVCCAAAPYAISSVIECQQAWLRPVTLTSFTDRFAKPPVTGRTRRIQHGIGSGRLEEMSIPMDPCGLGSGVMTVLVLPATAAAEAIGRSACANAPLRNSPRGGELRVGPVPCSKKALLPQRWRVLRASSARLSFANSPMRSRWAEGSEVADGRVNFGATVGPSKRG